MNHELKEPADAATDGAEHALQGTLRALFEVALVDRTQARGYTSPSLKYSV
jgi:hypothetical protein